MNSFHDGAEVEEMILKFVARELAISIRRMRLDSQLYGDLGLYGDVVDEFFARFSRQFTVDMAGADLRNCFPGEGVAGYIVWKLRLPAIRDYKALRVSTLVDVARKGKWA